MSRDMGEPGRIDAERLQLYFDEELDADDANAVAQALVRDPSLAGQLEELQLLRRLVTTAADTKASEMPAARFAQTWDEIDRAITRDSTRGRSATTEGVSIWQRLLAVVIHARVPLLAGAGAIVLVLALVRLTVPPQSPAESPSATSQIAVVSEPSSAVASGPTGSPPVAADDAVFPTPRAVEAEIHGVDFGSNRGSISHTGVATVLYVEEEDEQPQNSERSL